MEQILYWMVGAFGVPIINWLKNLTGAEGKSAMWVTAAVATGLGALALFTSNEVNATEFTFEALVAVVGQILAAATLAYKLLQKE